MVFFFYSKALSGFQIPDRRLLLFIILACLLITLPAYAEMEPELRNQDGYNYLIINGAAIITGYNGPGGEITIPWSLGGVEVKEIRADSFAGNETIVTVNIPGSVKKIGRRAFAGCPNLINILLPSAIETLEESTFENSGRLASILIPGTVRSIERNTFKGCASLFYVYFQSTGLLSFVGEDAFQDTPWLAMQTDEFVIVANSVLIQYNGSAKAVMLPWNAYYIGNAFENNTEIEKVILAEWTIGILPNAFRGSSSLRSVEFNANIEFIGAAAFEGCTNLTEVLLPDTVKTIGQRAFANCPNLQKVTLSQKLTRLEPRIFQNCKSLQSIIIPDTVTEIGSSAFENCWSLNFLGLGSGLTKIGRRAFAGTAALNSILLPETLREIGSGAFADCGLKTVTLPEGITTLQPELFNGCFQLTQISLPASIITIDDSTFPALMPLIVLPDQISAPDITADPKPIEQFVQKNQLTFQYAPLDTDVYRFKQDPISNSYTLLQALQTMPEQWEAPEAFNGMPVTKIGTAAFQAQELLRFVEIGNSYTEIGDWAFSFCPNLQTVTIGQSVQQIGADAFSGDESLESVVIPPSVKTIGERAFSGCPNLTIIGAAGSAAETFAQINKISFRVKNEFEE